MNDFQNTPLDTSKKYLPLSNILKWVGIIGGIVILVICGILLSQSSESPVAFLVKWKSALESGDIKKYDALWGKNARSKSNAGYGDTVQLFKENLEIDVKIDDAEKRTRKDPTDPNYLRVEEIPIIVHAPGEPLLQKRTLTIAKTGLIQQRWKLIMDEVVSEEISSEFPDFEEDSNTEINSHSDSPVAQFVLEWKNALESQNEKKYTSLWDKSARRKRKENFQTALVQISQELDVDLSQATYSPVAYSKTRHLVDNISVTISSAGTYIQTHNRTLTIEKKGFFMRKWKLINDVVGEDDISDPSISQIDQLTEDAGAEQAISNIYNGNAPLDTQLKVGQILGKWQKAWEEKDVDTYMSIYAERALITRVTVRNGNETSIFLRKDQLKKKMKKLNLHYGDIQVEISKLVINGDRAVADVEFLQKFKGIPATGSRPAYSDIGTKKLNLMVDPADGYWKIYSETWSRYEDVPEFPKN